jgi:phytoene dehydrogenase-like protein
MMTLGPLSRGSAGYPMGGPLAVARTLERRLLGLGGRIIYQSRVTRVLERAGRAVGVQLESGDEVAADHVISACDLRTTLGSLVAGDRAHAVHRELLEQGRLYAPLYLVNSGYQGILPDEVSCTGSSYELEEPLELAGRWQTFFGVKSSIHDPGLTPEGTSVVGSGGPTDWSYWQPLLADRQAYDAAKQRLAETCLEQIEQRYPGFSSKVELTDVVTPHTFNRYTGNWQGVYMTWNLSSEFHRRHAFVPKTVPGLAGFYMASMWTYPPGGVVGASAVGRGIIQILCHDDRQEFTSSTS